MIDDEVDKEFSRKLELLRSNDESVKGFGETLTETFRQWINNDPETVKAGYPTLTVDSTAEEIISAMRENYRRRKLGFSTPETH